MRFSFISLDYLFWVSAFTCGIILYFTYKKSFYLKYVKIVFFFRILSLGILTFLLIDPRFTFFVSQTQDLYWNVYVDKSLSMINHSRPSLGTLQTGIDQVINKLNERKIKHRVFGFGVDLDTNWVRNGKNFIDGSTNIGMALDHIKDNKNKQLAGSIIITDGQANLGKEIPSNNLDHNNPIHIIGVGNTNPFIDVAIKSIDSPPVIIKGENAEIIVAVTYNGIINKNLNITLSSGEKLLGSKVISHDGNSSVDKVRFLITPDNTGRIEYQIKVNTLVDEVNIDNNKQDITITILKDIYRIAIITGAPNFNTQFLKRTIKNNLKAEFDHFLFKNNEYSFPLKRFWETNYDLIIFDNHPIKTNSQEWESYLRIFAKKILLQKSSFILFPGYDIEPNVFESYLQLMEMSYEKSFIDLGNEYPWSLTNDWELFFPFKGANVIQNFSNNYPPLFSNLNVNPANSKVLASFEISGMEIPLLLLSEKSPLRYGIWTSPDLYKLHFKNQYDRTPEFLETLIKPVISWLLKTGDEKNFYFRTKKESYQQGEQISVTGKPVDEYDIEKEGFIHIYQNDSLINSKKLYYETEKKFYFGSFWASKPGNLTYEIQLLNQEKPIIVHRGQVLVQKSQIELNNIFLNEFPLQRLSSFTNGTYNNWDDRLSLINNINQKKEKITLDYQLVVKNNKWLILFVIFIVAIDWIIRKRYRML